MEIDKDAILQKYKVVKDKSVGYSERQDILLQISRRFHDNFKSIMITYRRIPTKVLVDSFNLAITKNIPLNYFQKCIETWKKENPPKTKKLKSKQ